MIKKAYLVPLTIVVLVLAVSCGLVGPVEDLEGNYYPLGFGYEWSYDQLEGSPYTTRIIEETEINGKTYFRNENDYSDRMRSESNKLYQLHGDEEFVVIDFNRPAGYVWEHPIYDRTNTILSKSALFDTISNCILIASESDIDYMELLYAPDIGLVNSYMEGRGDVIIISGNSRLISAIINEETIDFDE